MSSINQLLGTHSYLSPDNYDEVTVNGSKLLCIDTSNNRIGINTIDPSYSIGTSVNTRLKQAYSKVPGAIAPVSKALSFRALQLNRKDD